MFTDDDLKRLKLALHCDGTCSGNVYLPHAEYRALLARLESHERLDEWLEHDNSCIRSFWSSGEPTADGGYREKFADKWYESKPVDKTPRCNCGLEDALEAWRRASGRE